jgi:hypothetical protein
MTTNAYADAIAGAKNTDMLGYLRDHVVQDETLARTRLADVFEGYSKDTAGAVELPTRGYVRVCMRMLGVPMFGHWAWRCKLV